MSKKEKDTQKQQEEQKKKQNEEVKEEQEEKEEQAKQEKEEQAEDTEEKLEEKKEEKQEKSDAEKLSEMQDKYLRLTAEYDNYRKRTLKEKMELAKSANEDVLQSLLPVMDDFERALQSIDESQDIDSVKEGIHLIYNKLKETLEQKGVKEIEAKEEDFDTDKHEAVSKIPAPNDDMKGKVVDVIQKGYYLKDKVLRYAKVVIGE